MREIRMKQAVWVLAFLVLLSYPAAADIDFANVANSTIKFDGDGSGADFTFVPNAAGVGFVITSGSLADDYYGSITGTFHYSNITSTTVPGGTIQTAPVDNDAGTFSIWDKDKTSLFAASVNWIDIYTFGKTGGLNTSSGGQINLTNFLFTETQTGAADTLKQALAGTNGSVTVSFQFDPAESLTQLIQTGTHSTSYSGTLTVPDGGMTLMLLGGALAGIESLRRRLHA